MEEPTEKVEDTTEEVVEIPKSRLDALTKQEAREGYRTRQVEKQLKELQDKYEELASSRDDEADSDDKAKRFQAMKRLHQEKADAQRVIEEAQKQKLENKALELALKYNMEAAELADCKTEIEMENRALRVAFDRKASPSVRGVDLGSGGSGSGQTDAQITAEYIANPTAANRAKFEKVRERGGWA